MSDVSDDEDATTESAVKIYEDAKGIFESLLAEVKELSRKKPEATISASKVKIINKVLEDLLGILKDEPTGKYLELLDGDVLPQMSDAVLMMVQFEAALKAFKKRYLRYSYITNSNTWITNELLAENRGDEDDEDGDDEEDEDEEDQNSR